MPATATWKAAGATVNMDSTFPDGDAATLKFTLPRPKSFTLALRRPSWAGNGFEVKVNGKVWTNVSGPGSYVELKRTWKTGDTVSLVLPKTLRIEGLPDNKNRAALMWGPLVLAGDLGPERRGGSQCTRPVGRRDLAVLALRRGDEPGATKLLSALPPATADSARQLARISRSRK